ncbi:anti-sigma factor [Candidatus Woesebacteria bacterium]|nr:MAG: anti-sigma factor [Candidatus Woesebacteria bacterium]
MKERELKQKNLIILLGAGLLVILVLLVGGFFKNSRFAPGFNKLKVALPQNIVNRISSPHGNIIETVLDNPNSLRARLTDVTKGTSSGVAYVLHEENSLTHYVKANLPELTDDFSYEGWLVNPTTNAYISTGKFNKVGEGEYSLTYMTQKDYMGYDKVVVTIEKILDSTPETHVLEGLAK